METKTMPQIPAYYTPKELMEILDGVKARGGRTVEMPGFKFTWDLGAQGARPPERRPAQIETMGDYVFTFGKYKGRALREVPRKDLADYRQFLLDDSDGGRALNETVLVALDKADRYLREGA